MLAIASSAPAVVLAHLASATTSIRLGSGGVMLPNHAPLIIAEQFGTLEALHPGRIDLGLGRAPGTDPRTARALRRSPDLRAASFPDDVVELIGYLLPREGPSPTLLPRRAAVIFPRSGSSGPPPTALSWPACSGCPSPSPITSPPTCSTRLSRSTARPFSPPCCSITPTSWSPSRCCARPRRRRLATSPAQHPQRSPTPHRQRGTSPLARRGGGVPFQLTKRPRCRQALASSHHRRSRTPFVKAFSNSSIEPWPMSSCSRPALMATRQGFNRSDSSRICGASSRELRRRCRASPVKSLNRRRKNYGESSK